MIADENALKTFPIGRTAPTWRTRLGIAHLVAAILARLRKSRAEWEPDPFATEMPFLSDFWPQN